MAEKIPTANDDAFPLAVEPFAFNHEGQEVVCELQRFDREAADEEYIAARCGDAKQNRKASQDRVLAGCLNKAADTAVYIVHNGHAKACKIGVSANPIKRMEGLQVASPTRLTMTHLFWLPSKAAFGLEGRTLRVMGKLGKRLMGEWNAVTAEQASVIIATLAKASNVPFSDSQMTRNNIRAMRRAAGLVVGSDEYRADPLRNLMRHSVA